MFKTLQAQKCWSTFSNGEICLKDELKINYAYHFPLFSSRFHDYIFGTLASPPGFKVPDIIKTYRMCRRVCARMRVCFSTFRTAKSWSMWEDDMGHNCTSAAVEPHLHPHLPTTSCTLSHLFWLAGSSQAASKTHQHSTQYQSTKALPKSKSLKFVICFIISLLMWQKKWLTV